MTDRGYARAKLLSEVAREERDRQFTETMEIDLADAELLRLCMMAHERDMTLNEMICYILEQVLEDLGSADTELALGDDQEPPVA